MKVTIDGSEKNLKTAKFTLVVEIPIDSDEKDFSATFLSDIEQLKDSAIEIGDILSEKLEFFSEENNERIESTT